MRNHVYKLSLLVVLLVMCMSVAMAADVSEDTTSDLDKSYDDTVDNSVAGLATVNEPAAVQNQKTGSTKILNSTTYKDYVVDGKFTDSVENGDTIDIQGKLDSYKFSLTIDRPVNIISSTNDSYIDFDTISADTSGNYKNGAFNIVNGASGTNITGLYFHNTRIMVDGANNVNINNITVLTQSNVGNGVGSFSIRGGSENVTVANSVFTNNPTTHSNVVIAGASNCLLENNTIQGIGSSGNLLYATSYGASGDNKNIIIRNNTIKTIDIPSSSMICWGVVLQGIGFTIENNYFDTNYPVMGQYSDSDYGVETIVNDVIFNNNTVVKGAPTLQFPGIVANNTFMEGAMLKNNYAYNNAFNDLSIGSNVRFENNTAKTVNINGKNNILNNNAVYASSSDYAITITGENNTLTNNKLVSLKGRGDKAISASSEITSINNSEDVQGVYYIDDNNVNNYFDISGIKWNIKNVFKNNDIIVINTSIKNINIEDDEYYYDSWEIGEFTLYFENITSLYINMSEIYNNIIYRNCYMPSAYVNNEKVTLYNCTVFKLSNFISSSFADSDSIIFYNLDNILISSGYLGHKNPDSSSVDDFVYVSYYLYNDLIVDNPFNYVGIPGSYIEKNTYFKEGSEGCNVTGVIFNGNVEINASNINFYNCTFNSDVFVNTGNINFEGNLFNKRVMLNSSYDTKFNNNSFNSEDIPLNFTSSRRITIENNTVNTSSEKTISFDENSANNVIKNNNLIAGDLLGDDTIFTDLNTVEDNGPAYSTEINIVKEDKLFINEPTSINISVNNKLNNSPVDKGYVEIYFDGVFQKNGTLRNGQYVLDLSKEDTLNDFTLTVWYIDGVRYANNRTLDEITFNKANVTLLVDEFSAKLNEKTNIKVAVTKENGQPLEEGNITFTIGTTKYVVEVKDGIANLNELVTKEWLDNGKLTITFDSSEAFNRNIQSINLNTTKDDVVVTPVVTVENNVADVDLTLVDSLQENVIDGRISISTLNGQVLATGRVSNGKFISSVTLPEAYTEEYLVANYTGSYYYNDFIRNIKITQMLNSTITLETNSPLAGEELIITGKLTDTRNNPITANVTLNLNGTRVTVATDENGEYNYSYVPGLGVNTITVTFDGNSDVYGTSTSKNVTIRDTDRDMNEVLNQLEELQKENDKLQEQLTALQEQLNNQTSELTQQNEALTTIISALTDLINNQNEQIAALQDQIASLSAPENTTIVLDDVSDAKYNSNVTISGTLISQKGLALSGQTVTITVNDDEPVNIVTVNGAFEYTVVSNSVGEQTVTVSYAGSEDYAQSEASTTFNVEKLDTVISLDDIRTVKKGDVVTITGTLTDANGNKLQNSVVRLLVNNGRKTLKTDENGVYSFDYTMTRVGENTVQATFEGNTYYNEATTSITVDVKQLETFITLDAINPVVKGGQATISGNVTDENGNAVAGAQVKILINGSPKTIKADKDGVFTYTYTMGKVGTNNITVSYAGSANYVASNTTATVEVSKAVAVVLIDPVDDVYQGDNITVSGCVKDAEGNAVAGAQVKILINGSPKTVKADNNGVFTFTLAMKKVGTNNITVVFNGNNNFEAADSTATVEVIKAE